MFEMFAIMCMLSYPDETMNSQLDCTTFYEDPPKIYKTIDECNLRAYEKTADTLQQFHDLGIDFKSIQVGCNKIG